jgi:predicted transposase YbfD/YdcC
MDRDYFERHFGDLEDTRYHGFVEHKLVDVLILVMCGTLCGLDEPESIVEYGNEKKTMLQEMFQIELIPSLSTLTRVLNMVDGEKVARRVIRIMCELLGTDGYVVPIDGKTICSTAKEGSAREALHIVSAYLTSNGVTLGQLTVSEKTNEIPVVRDLLDMIDIRGKIVTADAMHCQKETAKKIIENHGNYVLGLKANQPLLHDEIKLYIEDCVADRNIYVEMFRTQEKSRDRIETRTCYKAPSLDWFESKDEWAGLSGAFMVHRRVERKGKTTEETAFYITSLNVPVEKLLELSREHWKIESMHWLLDVVFSEDDCRIISPNGQKTMNVFRKLALAVHKNYIESLPLKTKPSIRKHMLRSLLSTSLLRSIICHCSFTVS